MRQPRRPIPTVRVRLRAEEELRAYCAKEMVINQRRRPRPVPVRRIKRTYTMRQHMLVVYLRHRSLTDFSRVWHRWCEIVRLTGVLESTCRGMVLRFLEKGAFEHRKKPLPRPLPQDVIDYLRNNLYEHRFLSLRKRCELI